MMSRGRGRRASNLVPIAAFGMGFIPEMVEHLRLRWRDDLSMEALLGLRDELDEMLGRIRSTRHIPNPVFKCPRAGTSHVAPIPTSVFAPQYWRWLASAWPRENRYGRLRRPGPPTERRRDLICTATPRRQNPFDSQYARTPMNGEPRTDLIQVISMVKDAKSKLG